MNPERGWRHITPATVTALADEVPTRATVFEHRGAVGSSPLRLLDAPVPEPRPREVRVRVQASRGIGRTALDSTLRCLRGSRRPIPRPS